MRLIQTLLSQQRVIKFEIKLPFRNDNVFDFNITIFNGKRLPIQMSHIRQFAIRNELLYSGFVLPNVQIFFVKKFSFATFGVSIDDFFQRYMRHLYGKPFSIKNRNIDLNAL